MVSASAFVALASTLDALVMLASSLPTRPLMAPSTW